LIKIKFILDDFDQPRSKILWKIGVESVDGS